MVACDRTTGDHRDNAGERARQKRYFHEPSNYSLRNVAIVPDHHCRTASHFGTMAGHTHRRILRYDPVFASKNFYRSRSTNVCIQRQPFVVRGTLDTTENTSFGLSLTGSGSCRQGTVTAITVAVPAAAVHKGALYVQGFTP
jgi:hypothetical protein